MTITRQGDESTTDFIARLLEDDWFCDASDGEIAALSGCDASLVEESRGMRLAWEHARILAKQIDWPTSPSALLSVALEHYAKTIPGRRGAKSPWEHPGFRARMVADREAAAAIGGRSRR